MPGSDTTPGTGTVTPATTDERDFVDIDGLGKLDLPSLPVLRQEKDWKRWWNNIVAYFELLELESFLIEDIQEPQSPEKKKRWLKCRRFMMIHLLKALSSGVQKYMEVLGWDTKSPYNTIETASKAIMKVSSDSLRQLLDSWNRLNAKHDQNIKEFIQRIHSACPTAPRYAEKSRPHH
jgi:hypothetical protein